VIPRSGLYPASCRPAVGAHKFLFNLYQGQSRGIVKVITHIVIVIIIIIITVLQPFAGPG
jgi:hypothetical protein